MSEQQAEEIQSFELPDGRKIDVHTGKRIDTPVFDADKMATIPTNEEAKQLVVDTRRKLVDLPDVPQKMNIISTVVSYTLFGLEEDEIAVALGVEVQRIRAIKMLDAYADMYGSVVDGIKSRDLDPINKMIEDQTPHAVNKIVSLMQEADSDAVSLTAARDILDRSGRRPADVHEHRVMHSGGLMIEHIERSEHANIEGMNDALDADFVDITATPNSEESKDGNSS